MPRRGEVWWVRLDLIVSTDIVHKRRRTVAAVPLSTSLQAVPPLLVPVRCGGRYVVAVVDQIRAVAKERLDKRMGELSSGHLAPVEQGLREILELG